MKRLIVKILAVLALAGNGQAQNDVWQTDLSQQVGFELSKPSISSKSLDGFDLFSFASSFHAVLGSGKTNLVLRVPFYTADFDVPNDWLQFHGYSFVPDYPRHSLVGNPYVGVRQKAGKSGIVSEFGVWLPLVSKSSEQEMAITYGLISHPLYVETLLPSSWSVSSSFSNLSRNSSGLSTKTRLGFTAIWPDGGDPMFFGDYAGLLFVSGTRMTAGMGINGRIYINDEYADGIGERTAHEFAFFLESSNRLFKPGIRIRIPLEEGTREAIPLIGDIYFSRSI